MTPSHGLRADGPLITGGRVRNHVRNAARECERASGRPPVRAAAVTSTIIDLSQHWICSCGRRAPRLVSGSASLPCSGLSRSKALRTSSALPRSWGYRPGSSHMWQCSATSQGAPTDWRAGSYRGGASELVTGADGFGLRATDGGLMPPLPSSVEPSGIPAGPTDEPGPVDEARGGDAVADAAQAPGALAAIPPPSKSAGLDSPVSSLPCRQTLPSSDFLCRQTLPSSDLPRQPTPLPTTRRRMWRRARAPRRMWSDS